MKKLFYLLLGIILFIPICVFADMSSPIIREYKATVKDPKGAPIYIYDTEKDGYVKNGELLEYGTIITIVSEESEFVCVDDECEKEVRIKDLVAVDKDYKISDKELSQEYDAIAIVDLEIKKGPASAYESTGVIIKAGTKFKARTIGSIDDNTKEFMPDEWQPYIYVNYNGIKGFVLSYDGTVGYGGRERIGIACIDLPLIDPTTNKEIEKIKANTIIKSTVYTSDIWSGIYYIQYNGKKGTVDNSYFLMEDDEIEFTTLKKINIYDNVNMDEEGKLKSKVIGTIPKGTIFKSKYYNMENWSISIRYEKGDLKGWVYAEVDEDENSESEYEGIDFEYPDEEKSDNEPIVVPSEINKSDKNNIIYLCIGAAVLVSITAVVTIILVNKKKTVKNE